MTWCGWLISASARGARQGRELLFLPRTDLQLCIQVTARVDEAAGRVTVHRLPAAGGRAQNLFPNTRYSTSITTTALCTLICTNTN
ncbi:hypothetical protein E2C01_018877 [Portunus trituberculatus]|uniref:Uncharacterized protein n=1 Tax=Portunus trituberculatus TaxID=210409 RepID=A0A5B7DWT6_PORTR|nr:hypothetical protein [Portunus trituberculatus]